MPRSGTAAEIERLLAIVNADPGDGVAQRDLGLALLQRVRETGDPSLYGPAQTAFEAARRLDPSDPLVLVGIGGLQLGRHDFAEALGSGRAALALDPRLAPAQAIVVDALIELGRYREADEAVEALIGMSIDLSSLARFSYVRELHGELDRAVITMEAAADSPGATPENTAYVTALLGNLLVYTGRPDEARQAYERALDLVPEHAPSIAGLGRLAVGEGDLPTAIALFERASRILPLPEYVVALGEAQVRTGLADDARTNFELARAMIQLFRANGVTVDTELALFEADHGDARTALRLAEEAYAATPTVRAADALAWALHRLGRDDEAAIRSKEALRLGSVDPSLRYHAGAIAAARGDLSTARQELTLALRVDPGFSAVGAAEARRILDSFGGR